VTNVSAGEECDDGEGTLACDDTCLLVACGDGEVDPRVGEECDGDGRGMGGETALCNIDCSLSACGDGVTNMTAGEECDDLGESMMCDADCTARICGDGVTNATAGEECDDMVETAGCDVDCTLVACGDGLVNMTAGEQCDDMVETVTCDVDCTVPFCGDGVLNVTFGEVCDDGGESMMCDADCTPAMCGDGVTNMTAGEQCDTGGPTATCDANCMLIECGDGVVNAAVGEECDDAGESATCDLDCTFVTCGDGVTNTTAGEACDDAGESMSCDDDCTAVECGDGNANAVAGESCDDMGESASCDADCTAVMCGDGLANASAGEGCDDGGESATCDVDCTVAECGDGLTNASAGEGCDDGGESATCDVDCTAAQCGDGMLNMAAMEACDDGGESPACDVDCTAAECGDMTTNMTAGEQCDGGGRTAACDMDCTLLECGDGVANMAGGEECDDGGESATCDLDCTTAYCSDGVTNSTAGEECDDMGETASCDADCTLAVCGDGVVNTTAGEVCDGADLLGTTCMDEGYTGGALACDAGCMALDTSGCTNLPGVPVLALGFSPVKQFDFTWGAVAGADYYRLYESAEPGDPFQQLGGDVAGTSVSHTVALHYRYEASYYVSACNMAGCVDSATVGVMDSLVDAVGYVKASNTGVGNYFGLSVALSGDGNTLAVGAYGEDSNATGIDGDQGNDFAGDSGAVYVFSRDGMGTWSQQAYVKASNTGGSDNFGWSVALNGDGNTLAVGARFEDSSATGIDGDQGNNFAVDSGAVYVFSREGMGTWSQQAYVKASNTGVSDQFGFSVALNGDGNTLAVGARLEDSNATGIDGDQGNNSAGSSGAVYVFSRDGMGTWSQQAYVKASNTGGSDNFGYSVALNGDGNTLAVGARLEDSNATGIDGDQGNNSAGSSGAVYVFSRDGMGTWSQQAYVKASNTGGGDYFGYSVALNGDGNTLAVGALGEDSNATGIDGDQGNNSAVDSGAVYVFSRDGMGTWSQQAYVKASNTGSGDNFGLSVALNGDGNTLAVGAWLEDSNATGIDGDQGNNSASNSGAVYVFSRDGMGTWSQQAYVKASNTDSGDYFGYHHKAVALSDDGNTLAVGAYLEDSNATGIDGDQADDSSSQSGAVYLY